MAYACIQCISNGLDNVLDLFKKILNHQASL